MLCTGLWLALSAAGAGAASGNPAWISRAWQSDEGLPGNTVRGIAQTPDGFLWAAMENNLVRFDGVRFREVAAARAGRPAG